MMDEEELDPQQQQPESDDPAEQYRAILRQKALGMPQTAPSAPLPGLGGQTPPMAGPTPPMQGQPLPGIPGQPMPSAAPVMGAPPPPQPPTDDTVSADSASDAPAQPPSPTSDQLKQKWAGLSQQASDSANQYAVSPRDIDAQRGSDAFSGVLSGIMAGNDAASKGTFTGAGSNSAPQRQLLQQLSQRGQEDLAERQKLTQALRARADALDSKISGVNKDEADNTRAVKVAELGAGARITVGAGNNAASKENTQTKANAQTAHATSKITNIGGKMVETITGYDGTPISQRILGDAPPDFKPVESTTTDGVKWTLVDIKHGKFGETQNMGPALPKGGGGGKLAGAPFQDSTSPTGWSIFKDGKRIPSEGTETYPDLPKTPEESAAWKPAVSQQKFLIADRKAAIQQTAASVKAAQLADQALKDLESNPHGVQIPTTTDAIVKAQTGNRVTEAQYHLMSNAGSILNQLSQKYHRLVLNEMAPEDVKLFKTAMQNVKDANTEVANTILKERASSAENLAHVPQDRYMQAVGGDIFNQQYPHSGGQSQTPLPAVADVRKGGAPDVTGPGRGTPNTPKPGNEDPGAPPPVTLPGTTKSNPQAATRQATPAPTATPTPPPPPAQGRQLNTTIKPGTKSADGVEYAGNSEDPVTKKVTVTVRVPGSAVPLKKSFENEAAFQKWILNFQTSTPGGKPK